MSETTRTLPALLAVLAGVCLLLISHSPMGLFVMGVIAIVAYLMRKQPLSGVAKIFYIAGGGVFGGLAAFSVILGVPQALLLTVILGAFCVSVLYTRMKV